MTGETWNLVGGGPLAVEGGGRGAVDDDAITELVALAKADKREDFDFLAGAGGVPPPRREALWAGTRARVKGASAPEAGVPGR